MYHALHIGGAEKELLAYISNLNKVKYGIHLALTNIAGELLADIPANISIHKAEGDSFKPDSKYLFNLYRIINTVKPSIVVGVMQDVNFNILLIRALTHKPYKVVASEQIILSEWQKIKKTPWLKKILIKALYRRANAIAGQAPPILRDLEQNFGINKKRLFLIPSFVTKNTFKAHRPLKHRSTNTSPYFLYVGRLAPEKNIELLLRAFVLVLARHRDTELIIVSPYSNSYYQDICKNLDILQSVRFVGYVSEPKQYYCNELALIIPSFVEGRSRVMIEAMLAYCPVICSNFVGHSDYITDNVNGLIFNKNSIRSLAHKMTYALQYPNCLEQVAKQANLTIQNHFPKEYISNYRRTLSQLFDRALDL